MRIEIEIPKEFEEHFKQDKFEDTLHRLIADAHLIAGNYEKETAIMLIKAFKESKPAYDPDAVVAQLEGIYERNNKKKKECYEEQDFEKFVFYSNVNNGIYTAIDIVRKGGVHEQ